MRKNLPAELFEDVSGELCDVGSGVVCSTHEPSFSTFPIDCRYRTIVESSHPISSASARVVCRISTWIRAFRRPSSIMEGRPQLGVSLMSKLPSLKSANHSRAVPSARVFSLDGTKVSGGFCSFGASTALVAKKVSETFVFVSWALHSF